MEISEKEIFQNHMPGNVCFGCGKDNHDGLQINSFWAGDVAICEFMPEPKHNGWKDILNGGIIATIIDCHCMGTAAANAYLLEKRPLGSEPEYRYATGTLNVKYLKPTSNLHPVELRATVMETKGKKTVMQCDVISQGMKTAVAEVVAIRVYDGSQEDEGNLFKG